MKPSMLLIYVTPAARHELVRDFVDFQEAFFEVDGRFKANFGLGEDLMLMVWAGDLTVQDAAKRGRAAITRCTIGAIIAQPIEGTMASTNPDDPVSLMVNAAWREWSPALN